MIVYVTTQGSRIIREGRHLLVKLDEDVHHTLFVHKLEQLILCGNVSLTPPALNLLLREEIDTVFLRRDGRYKGRLALAEPKNVYLRRRQFQLAGDEAFCLNAARRIVQGKLLNMATVLQRIKRTRQANAADGACNGVRAMLSRLDTATSLDQLRGMEGQASACYFSGLRHGLDDDFGFRRRIRRPPTDPVNSVLSLLYTFLINRMVAAVRLAGLDPYPGVLHSLDYGRQALPLDLVEEFRAPLADTVALALFNLRVLKQEDFYVHFPAELALPPRQSDALDAVSRDPLGVMSETEDEEELFDIPDQQLEPEPDEAEGRAGKGAMRLHPPAFKKVVGAFEKKLQSEFHHPVADLRMTFAEALVFQARQFRRLVEGESGDYHPLLLR
jgi:CRISPR-associated protein Cas1